MPTAKPLNSMTMWARRSAALRGAILLAGLCALWVQPASAEPEIKWRVSNAFRLFTDPSNSDVHRATYELGME
jgi:hypothetical protein